MIKLIKGLLFTFKNNPIKTKGRRWHGSAGPHTIKLVLKTSLCLILFLVFTFIVVYNLYISVLQYKKNFIYKNGLCLARLGPPLAEIYLKIKIWAGVLC